MTRYKLIMTAFAAVGAAVLLGTSSGCNDTSEKSNLLINPSAARQTDKLPTTLDNLEPIAGDTVVPVDSTQEQFDGVCTEPADPVDPVVADGGPVAEPAPCATMSFHQKWPPWKYSTNVTGTHLKTRAEYSNYDIGGGKIIRHIKTWPLTSTYYRFGF